MANPEWSVTPNTYETFGKSTRLISGVTLLDPIAKSIVLLTAGDVTVTPAGSSQALAFVGLPAGYIIPFQVKSATATAGVAATID